MSQRRSTRSALGDPALIEEATIELGHHLLAHPSCVRCARPVPEFTTEVCPACTRELAEVERQRWERDKAAKLLAWRKHGHIYRQREVEKGRRGPGSGRR